MHTCVSSRANRLRLCAVVRCALRLDQRVLRLLLSLCGWMNMQHVSIHASSALQLLIHSHTLSDLSQVCKDNKTFLTVPAVLSLLAYCTECC